MLATPGLRRRGDEAGSGGASRVVIPGTTADQAPRTAADQEKWAPPGRNQGAPEAQETAGAGGGRRRNIEVAQATLAVMPWERGVP